MSEPANRGPARPLVLATDRPADVFEFWSHHKLCGIQNNVELLSDGEDVLTYFAGIPLLKHPPPALLIIALNMPQMGGLETLQKLAASYQIPFPRVLLIDAAEQDASMANAATNLGVEALLIRPIFKGNFCSLMSRFANRVIMTACVPSCMHAQARIRSGSSSMPRAVERAPVRYLALKPRTAPASKRLNGEGIVGTVRTTMISMPQRPRALSERTRRPCFPAAVVISRENRKTSRRLVNEARRVKRQISHLFEELRATCQKITETRKTWMNLDCANDVDVMIGGRAES